MLYIELKKKKMKSILFSITLLLNLTVQAQGSIPIPISTDIFFGNQDEWIHLKITDTLTNQVWYDTLATVTVSSGFVDTVYLDSATYKCEILSIGANVNMPTIELDDGSFAQWGYPDYEYYLFTIPASEVGLQKQYELSQILMYPNPTANSFTVEAHDFLIYGSISVEDYLGRTILVQKLDAQKSVNINISDFPDGVYFIQINHERYSKVEQLVKIGY